MYCMKNQNSLGIHERSPFGVILYGIINLKNLNGVFEQITDLSLLTSAQKFLVILFKPENFSLVLQMII